MGHQNKAKSNQDPNVIMCHYIHIKLVIWNELYSLEEQTLSACKYTHLQTYQPKSFYIFIDAIYFYLSFTLKALDTFHSHMYEWKASTMNKKYPIIVADKRNMALLTL